MQFFHNKCILDNKYDILLKKSGLVEQVLIEIFGILLLSTDSTDWRSIIISNEIWPLTVVKFANK